MGPKTGKTYKQKEITAKVKSHIIKVLRRIIHSKQITVLFDARELQIDSAKRMNDTLNRIEATVEKISLRTVYNKTQLR